MGRIKIMENQMKYYTNISNQITTFFKDGSIELDSPIREDGTLLPNHKNLGTIKTKADGSYYTYYNEDGTPDTVKEQELSDVEELYIKKHDGTLYIKADDTEYLVSLTAEDANGLVSAKIAFDMGVTNTNFVFSNGTIVPIGSVEELLHLGAFVATERNSFFVGVA